jgi:CMP-N,N'-diacetyllegionaminic acid synthase
MGVSGADRVLGVIPARGGSKGVPRKNVRPVCGKPLIAYSIESALAARDVLDRIVVSTDDEEIAAVARQYGADVPFMRPADIAGDRVPMVPVLQHAVRFAEQDEGRRYDWVCLMQPTEPFRTADDIRAALDLGRQGGCDSVISVVQVFAVHPMLMKRIDNGQLLPWSVPEPEGTRRQDYQPAAYMRNGAVYLTRRDVLMERGSIWGAVIRPLVMPPERSVGVDSDIDMKLVELLMAQSLGRRG